MTDKQVDEFLQANDVEMVPITEGTLLDMKRLKSQCLEAEIMATLGCPAGKT